MPIDMRRLVNMEKTAREIELENALKEVKKN